jgi:hypothetical protein
LLAGRSWNSMAWRGARGADDGCTGGGITGVCHGSWRGCGMAAKAPVVAEA